MGRCAGRPWRARETAREPWGSHGGASDGQSGPARIREGSGRPASVRLHGRGESLPDVAIRARVREALRSASTCMDRRTPFQSCRSGPSSSAATTGRCASSTRSISTATCRSSPTVTTCRSRTPWTRWAASCSDERLGTEHARLQQLPRPDAAVRAESNPVRPACQPSKAELEESITPPQISLGKAASRLMEPVEAYNTNKPRPAG